MKVAALLPLMLVTTIACDPQLKISGHVVGFSDGGAAGQVVHLECPESARITVDREVVTDSAGHYEFAGVGCAPDTCALTLPASPDLPARPIAPWCRSTARGCSMGTCTDATLDLGGGKF